MLKSYKYRLCPTEKQKEHFVQSMGCVRYIFNKGLEVKIKHYEKTGKTLSYFDLTKGFLLEEKEKNEWLKAPNAQSLQSGLRNLDNAFNRYFKKTSKFPSFKRKNGKQSIQYSQCVSVYFNKNKIKIPKAGEVSIVFDREFIGKIKTCTVSKTPTNKFYISILVENDLELPAKSEIKSETSIGIDLGIKTFATISNGEKIDNPKYLRKFLDRLKILQRRASKKSKGSKNKKKANLKVAKLHEKISNQRNDFLHKLSSKLISENQTIILEDLNIAGMLKNQKLALTISDVSWGEFIRMLSYKAEWYGNNIIKIGRFDPSSKMCSCCGEINQNLKLSDRFWKCIGCNAEHDRDVNAAINIKKFGLIKVISGQELPAELLEMPCSNKDRRIKKSIKKKG